MGDWQVFPWHLPCLGHGRGGVGKKGEVAAQLPSYVAYHSTALRGMQRQDTCCEGRGEWGRCCMGRELRGCSPAPSMQEFEA